MLHEVRPGPGADRLIVRGDEARAFLIGSLALSARQADDFPELIPRALGWYRRLLELGVCLPFAAVLDLGFLLLDGESFRFRGFFADAALAATERQLRERYEAQFLVRRLQETSFGRLRRILTDNTDPDAAVSRVLELLLRPVAAALTPRLALDEIHGVNLDSAHLDLDAAREQFEAATQRPGLLSCYLAQLADAGPELDLDRRLAAEDFYELRHIRVFPRESLREVARRIHRVERLLGPPRRASARGLRARALAETTLESVGTYPTGGIAELSTSGPIENLVPSELVYLEPGEPVDLFLVRFAEGEHLRYLRDSAVLRMMRRGVIFVIEDTGAFACPIAGDRELHGTKIVRCLMGLVLALTADLLTIFAKDDLTIDVRLLTPAGETLETRTERQEILDVLHLLLREKEEQGDATIERIDGDLGGWLRGRRPDSRRQTVTVVLARPRSLAALPARGAGEASLIPVAVGGEAAEAVPLPLAGGALADLQAAREAILARMIDG